MMHSNDKRTHRITQAAILEFPVPEEKNGKPVKVTYYDDRIGGFGLRVTSSGSRSFILYKHLGKPTLFTLGRFPALSEPNARKKATIWVGKIKDGIDPRDEKRKELAKIQKEEIEGYTLWEAWEDYRKAREPHNKAKSLARYEQSINFYLSDWRNKPITAISFSMVVDRHRKISKKNGPASGNRVFRELKAILNFASLNKRTPDGKSILPENPVKALSLHRAWNKVHRRTGIIKPHEMPAFWKAARSLRDGKVDDLFVLLLLTGLRKMEALTLRWEFIDLTDGTLHIPETKSGIPHTLPMGDYLAGLMIGRERNARAGGSVWVFPGKISHLKNFDPELKKVRASFGRDFINHDLRRTFQTTIESLDVSWLVAKRLMNHSTEGDITAGYTVIDIERLRKPMQRVENRILIQAGIIKAEPAADLDEKRRVRVKGGAR